MTRPHVTVVIPTRGRETRLAFALDALADQTLASDEFEVIVVRDADAAHSTEPAPRGLNVRFLAIPGVAGPAPKRNLGWRAAGADLVAFTDDDCRPSRRWLERLVVAHRASGAILQGRTAPDPDEAHLLTGLARTVDIEGLSPWYETCNIAYPRTVLERLGGFDEAWDFIGDDTDLGIRAREAGFSFSYLEDALVWHAVHWRTLVAALEDATRRSPVPLIVARHPSQRRALVGGVVTDSTHLRLIAAACGVSLYRSHPLLATAAVLPYLRKRVDRRRFTSLWGVTRAPVQLVSRALLDGAEVVGLLAESARHRTLVL